MQYYITMPAMEHKHFKVEADNRVDAVLKATCITVWTEDEWNETISRYNYPSKLVNVYGQETE